MRRRRANCRHHTRGRGVKVDIRVGTSFALFVAASDMMDRMKVTVMSLAALQFAAAAAAQPYAAVRTEDHGIAIVRLSDAAHGVEVNIVPSIGNLAYEMKVHGHNILHFPYVDVSAFVRQPAQCAIPLLAPWANRMTENGFWANGKKYAFNTGLGNVRGDLPIHGLLGNSPLWRVTEVAADAHAAHVTSRLEFWKEPDLMAQWPFAHEYEMTYSLAEGVLEVRLTVANLSSLAMPLMVGFHPYYRIPEIPRDEWTAHIPARKRVVADQRRIPSGELIPMDLPSPLPLKDRTLDDGFTDLDRDSAGRAHFSIQAAGRTVEAIFGPKYPVAVVWEPAPPPGQTRDFICFEPMTAITSGVNLAHEGKYDGLQSVAPGARWTESFWVRSSGM
jgi:aldose 1-epimerase